MSPTDRISSFARDGLVFDVVDEGPLDGEIVVLLHGFPERASCWREVTPQLNARGFRTLAPDQRGYSPRARPAHRRDHAVGELVDDVAELITLAGGRAHVVGHDWGANVAWSIAGERPGLVLTLTAFSVPHPAAFVQAMRRSGQARRSWYMLAFQMPGFPEVLAKGRGAGMNMFMRRSGMTAADIARFRTEIVEYGALRGGVAWYRGLPFADRSRVRNRISVPTTMVWSDGDAFIDKKGVLGSERFVRAPYELVILPGVNHWIPTQAADQAVEAILGRILTER